MSEIPKKIIYIANIRLPTEKAHGIQVMEMCSAFANKGDEVTLVVPRRKNHIDKDPFQYHDVKENFRIFKLPCINSLALGKIGHIIQTASFAFFAALFSLIKTNHIFYTRDEMVAVCLRMLGKTVAWEGHGGEKNIVVRMAILLRVKMVMISAGLKDLYIGMGVSEKNILVAPDAADIDRFDIEISRAEARAKLGLPSDKKIVLYKGGMFAWKGPGTLAQAFPHMKHQEALIVFIGGVENDVIAFKKEFGHMSNLLILGNRPRQETPVYQKAADVLIIPNSAKEDISKLYTSPMKLFGYMASGRPIIASNLPSIREILNETNSHFFTADDALSLAHSIDAVLDNYSEAEKRAEKALHEVQVYSWKNRAQSILEFIGGVNKSN
ncbi:MAG: hypothetical protein RLY66_566 [Candidatus Parcubacteria bacterium]|jgi:glycosyltransferase involved in cell wall biosynthesis